MLITLKYSWQTNVNIQYVGVIFQRLDDRTETLNQAIKCYQKGRHDFVIKQTEDQIKLLKYQRRLEEEFNRPYMDLSLHQTIYRLTVENNFKVSEQLRKEFKIPDRRYIFSDC